ncbi:hypothetical protein BD410DRAFT_440109 [Rickenella mellea]|uniref:Uncharacterized protein n=1 Tax=Rickenella mellea TaxID=50990 RepID=A0A4Y7PVF3_9AGAM|nr:hypothetical protein BD410DRAFT_440109 [Rickenella mellea]
MTRAQPGWVSLKVSVMFDRVCILCVNEGIGCLCLIVGNDRDEYRGDRTSKEQA